MIELTLQRLRPAMRPRALWRALRSPGDGLTPEGRARERFRRVALSAGASAGAKLIAIVTSLVSVPLALHYLGPELYGIWLVITSFTVMLSFADMGLGNGTLNAVAREHGLGNRVAIRRIISSSYVMLGGISILLVALFAAVYPFVSWYKIFNAITPEGRAAAGPALAVFITCFALAITGSVIQKVQVGLQQSFVNSLWQALGSLLGLVAVLAVISRHGSLAMLVAALVGAPLVAMALNTASFFLREGADLRPSLALVSTPVMAATARIGGMFFLVQLIAAIGWGLDAIIVAQVAGAAMVAQYAVPERVFAIISMVIAMALGPLWPAYSEAIAQGDRAWVARTLRRSLGISALTSGLLSLFLLLFGTTLIHLWVGHSIHPSLLLLLGLGVWRVVEACGNATAYYLNGAGMMRSQAAVLAVVAAVKVVLKVALVRAWGPAGIPWGAAIAFTVVAGPPYLILIRRQLHSVARNSMAAPEPIE